MKTRSSVRFVLACVFLDALGVGLIVPVLPRLIGTLSETRDLQVWWYGAIMVSYGLMQFVSAPLLGYLSDRFGRRPVLLVGILGLGLTFAVPAFFASLSLILASRIIGGALSANLTVAQAYVADLTQGDERTVMFGRVGAVFGIGFVLGPALGGFVGESDPSLPFLLAFLLALCNFFYGLRFLPESLLATARETRLSTTRNAFLALPKLLGRKQMRPFFLVFAIVSLAIALLQCTWALYTEYRYGFTPLEIGLSIFALGASMSLVQGGILARLLRRYPASKILAFSILLSAVCLAGIGLADNGLLASLFCSAYAISAVVSPVIASAVSRLTDARDQGQNIGALNSLFSLMSALAPLLGTPLLGFVIHGASPIQIGAPYFAASLLMLLSLALFLKGIAKKIDNFEEENRNF